MGASAPGAAKMESKSKVLAEMALGFISFPHRTEVPKREIVQGGSTRLNDELRLDVTGAGENASAALAVVDKNLDDGLIDEEVELVGAGTNAEFFRREVDGIGWMTMTDDADDEAGGVRTGE